MKNKNILRLNRDILYDKFNKTLFIDKQIIKLTKNELLLLELLAKNHTHAVSYKEIENFIWTYEGMSMDALRSLVRTLRKTMRGEYVENISGIGYRLLTTL